MLQLSKYRRDSEFSRDPSIDTSQIFIPSCIFNSKLSSFETITKFLKEAYDLPLQKIAELLGKKKQSVWRCYKLATTKYPETLEVSNLYYPIPVSIFKNSRLSLLEDLVVFLHEKNGLTYSQVSALLKRDPRTVWTIHQRSVRKRTRSLGSKLKSNSKHVKN